MLIFILFDSIVNEIFFMILRIGDEYFVFILSFVLFKKYIFWKSFVIL